ncbi:MAG: hypothetical protein AB1899_03380 [Pseudomonadota bacterium]
MQRLSLAIPLMCLASLVHAQTPRALPDNREPILVSKAERNLVLAEMREFLHGLHNIHYSLARKDMKGVSIMAKPMGPLLERLPGSLKEKLPEGFTELAIAQNEAFQSLARLAENGSDVAPALEQTAEILTYCSGCHDTYRFDVPLAPKPRR